MHELRQVLQPTTSVHADREHQLMEGVHSLPAGCLRACRRRYRHFGSEPDRQKAGGSSGGSGVEMIDYHGMKVVVRFTAAGMKTDSVSRCPALMDRDRKSTRLNSSH